MTSKKYGETLLYNKTNIKLLSEDPVKNQFISKTNIYFYNKNVSYGKILPYNKINYQLNNNL